MPRTSIVSVDPNAVWNSTQVCVIGSRSPCKLRDIFRTECSKQVDLVWRQQQCQVSLRSATITLHVEPLRVDVPSLNMHEWHLVVQLGLYAAHYDASKRKLQHATVHRDCRAKHTQRHTKHLIPTLSNILPGLQILPSHRPTVTGWYCDQTKAPTQRSWTISVSVQTSSTHQ